MEKPTRTAKPAATSTMTMMAPSERLLLLVPVALVPRLRRRWCGGIGSDLAVFVGLAEGS